MKTIDFSYFIERYNAGEMTETEKQWFLKELDGNQSLRKEADLRAKADRILNDHAAFLLRTKLHEIEARRAEAAQKGSSKRSVFRYAAIMALLIAAGSIIVFNNRNYSNEKILEKFINPYEGIAPSRSLENSLNDDYTIAMEYYNTHDYTNAVRFFTKVLMNNPLDMGAAMYYGVSNFEQKNYPVAKKSFTTVVENDQNLFIEDAQWYLALCYIQTNETDKAISELNMIKNSDNLYRKQARKLLRRIR